MRSKRLLKRVLVLVLVFVAAPLALSGPVEADPLPVQVRLNDACAEGGLCCMRVGAICSLGGLIDHYYEPSGQCPPPMPRQIRRR
jgi:hypothetical protein